VRQRSILVASNKAVCSAISDPQSRIPLLGFVHCLLCSVVGIDGRRAKVGTGGRAGDRPC